MHAVLVYAINAVHYWTFFSQFLLERAVFYNMDKKNLIEICDEHIYTQHYSMEITEWCRIIRYMKFWIQNSNLTLSVQITLGCVFVCSISYSFSMFYVKFAFKWKLIQCILEQMENFHFYYNSEYSQPQWNLPHISDRHSWCNCNINQPESILLFAKVQHHYKFVCTQTANRQSLLNCTKDSFLFVRTFVAWYFIYEKKWRIKLFHIGDRNAFYNPLYGEKDLIAYK